MAKTRSRHQQELYSAYKSQNRFATNRKRKLLKLQKEQPNNEQITEALKNIKYRRKTPGTAMFSKTDIRVAKMNKEFSKKTPVTVSKQTVKYMFSLAARAHTKNGQEYPWASI